MLKFNIFLDFSTERRYNCVKDQQTENIIAKWEENMQENDLKVGISMLYDMELNNYMMARSETELEKEMSGLGFAEHIDPPQKPHLPKFKYNCQTSFFLNFAIFAVPVGVPLFFLMLASVGLSVAGLAFLGGLTLFALIFFLDYRKERKKHDLVMRKRKDDYDKSYGLYKLARDLDSERVAKEKNQQKLIIEQKNALVLKREDASTKLSEFYDKMGINEKFRNLVAMGYMNEFISLGISNKLEGTDGLYYLIMQELRWDQLQLSVQEIVDKLDAVIDSQRSLYYELMAINRRCDALVDATVSMAAEISKNNELISENNVLVSENNRLQAVGNYTSERILKEQEYSNFMTYYYERSRR